MKKHDVPLRKAFSVYWRGLRLWHRICPQIIWSSVASVGIRSISPYVTIWFSARIIDELTGNRDTQRLWRLVLLTIIVTGLMTLLSILGNRWYEHQHSVQGGRTSRLFTEKLLDMDFAVMDRQETYDLLSKNRDNNQWGGWGLIMVLWSFDYLLEAVVRILGAVALTVSLFTSEIPYRVDWLDLLGQPLVMTGVAVLLLSLLLASSALTAFGMQTQSKLGKEATQGNRIYGFFGFEAVSTLYRATDIRMYKQQGICEHYFSENDGFSVKGALAKKWRGPMSLSWAASSGVDKLFIGVVYVYVCLKAWAGAFGVGAVTQYAGAITAMSQGVLLLFKGVSTIQGNTPYLELVFQFLDLPHEMYQGSLTTEKRSDRQYQVEFRDVSFKYPGSNQWALRHVNMKFEVGRRLAVVGQNGSGKTTFIKLLCRLYDPTEGQILLNGIDIRKYNYQDYLAIFSVVFQDFQLLAFPLGQNVAAAKDYDPARAEDCLRKAGFGDRLDSLPDGLETCLYREFDQKGVEISGGEAQKIAIARALYPDAPFIILDEPTAALDPIAEAEIYSKFDEIAGDKTAIYISHRLSSCRFCDDILVFDQGRVIQQGSHEELVSDESGKYHALWHAQAQYYTKR